MLKPQTTGARDMRRRAYAAYGVILCHSTYRKLIDGGYVAHETPRGNSQPGMPSKIVSTLLEILESNAGHRSALLTRCTTFQPFLRF